MEKTDYLHGPRCYLELDPFITRLSILLLVKPPAIFRRTYSIDLLLHLIGGSLMTLIGVPRQWLGQIVNHRCYSVLFVRFNRFFSQRNDSIDATYFLIRNANQRAKRPVQKKVVRQLTSIVCHLLSPALNDMERTKISLT